VNHVFLEISLVILLATAISGLMQFLRQPLIIGHIITGLIVGPYLLNIVSSNETFEVFSQMGIALLLFIIGLSLNPKVIKEVGRISLITGAGQVIFTAIVGYLICHFLGYSSIESMYIAIALTFSSTIIIMKLLTDKKDTGRLYGKILIGFLLVQDIIATLILIAISSFSKGGDIATLASAALIKGVVLFLLLILTSIYIVPKLSYFFAKSQEFLFLFSIAWGLGIATLFQYSGFSIEIGALFAGVVLATSPYHLEISSRLKPLRDFFIVLFFILIGSQIAIVNLSSILLPALLLSLYVLVGNPIIFIIVMTLLKFDMKTSFKAGLAIAQISEFSLVLITLAGRLGHVDQSIVSLVTLVGLVTILVSTYFIIYSDELYHFFEPYLRIFERKTTRKDQRTKLSTEIVLFGFEKIGYDLLNAFKKMGKTFTVVDYNPETIANLEKEGINCIYGDADDNELLSQLNLEDVKMVISTITDIEASTMIVSQSRKVNKKMIIIAKTDEIEEAINLYDKGASYVMMPHYLGVEQIINLIDKHELNFDKFVREKEGHLSLLKEKSV
jgi:Kef-type K+ transport system membrane component KefB